MYIKLKDFSLYTEGAISNLDKENIILFLHGFTGSSSDWDEIIPSLDNNFQCITLDLIGHGKSDSPNNISYYDAASINTQLKFIISQITDKPVILAGYSMGGRAALNFAIENSGMISALILESATAGIKEESLRLDRIRQDEKLVKFINDNPIEKFIDYWMNIDLFSTQKKLPKEVLIKVREKKLQNNKIGLMNILNGFGTGKMIPLYEKLPSFYPKTLLITGELDNKYCEINSEMNKLFPAASHHILKDCGHNTHFEQSKKFIEEINTFLREF